MNDGFINIFRLPIIQDKLNSELRNSKFDSRIFRDCKQAIQLYWLNEISPLSKKEKDALSSIIIAGGVEIFYNEDLKEERFEFQNTFFYNSQNDYESRLRK